MGGAKRNPGSETLRGEAPDGAQEQTGPFVSEESNVRRAFTDVRYMMTHHAIKSPRNC